MSYLSKRKYSAYQQANKSARSRSGSAYKKRRTRASSFSGAPLASRGFRFPMKGELKFAEVDSTGAIAFGVPATGATGALSIVLLNGLSLGTAAQTRVGRKINMRSIMMRAYFNAAATTTSGFVRVMLVYDRQANGTAPTAADILAQGGTPFITSINNLDNRERFLVIHDKTRYLSAGSAVSDTNAIYYKKYKRLALETTYNSGSSGTVGDINTGAMYLVVFTSCGIANVNARITTRIRFSDS